MKDESGRAGLRIAVIGRHGGMEIGNSLAAHGLLTRNVNCGVAPPKARLPISSFILHPSSLALGLRRELCEKPGEEFAALSRVHLIDPISWRAVARASIQFFQAIRQPSRMKAPGGNIAIKKPG